MANAGELVVGIVADASDLEKGLKSASRVADTQMAKISKAILAAGVAYKVFEGIGKGIEFNKAAEQAQVAFTVMTGSAEKATQILKELKTFANNTPLEFQDIRDAAQTLLQFGIETDKVNGYVRILGDVSGGNADKLKSISLAFGQIASTGRLMGQDLLQLINVGFNPLQEISAKTGRSMADLKKDMENGLISFDMVEDAFVSATSEGGRFFGMLEKQSQTVAGKLSTMNDAIDTMAGALTESLSEPLKIGAELVTEIANAITGLPMPVRAATTVVLGFGSAMIATKIAAEKLGIALPKAFGPIGLVVGVAATAIAAIAGLVGELNKMADTERRRVQTTANLAENVRQIIAVDGDLAATLKSEGSGLSVFGTVLDNLTKVTGRSAQELSQQYAQIASGQQIRNIQTAIAGLVRQRDDLARSIRSYEQLDKSMLVGNALQQYNKLLSDRQRITADITRQENEIKRIQFELTPAGQAQLKAKIEEERIRANILNQIKTEHDEIAGINNLVSLGMINSAKAAEMKIAVHNEVIKKYQDEIVAGKTLSNAARRDYDNRVAQVGALRKLTTEAVNQRNSEEKANFAKTMEWLNILQAQAMSHENELKEFQIQESNRKTDNLIQYYEEVEAAQKKSFERQKAEEEKRAEEQKQIYKQIWTSIQDVATAAIDTIFKLNEKNINKSLDLQLSAIDKETRQKMYAAGIRETSARDEYRIIESLGDEAEQERKKRELEEQFRIRGREYSEIKASENATEQQIEDARERFVSADIAYYNHVKKMEKYSDQDKNNEIRKAADLEKIVEESERKKMMAKYRADKEIFDAQIAQTIVNGAAAIVTGFAQLGPVAGAIAAVGTGIVTGAQLGIMYSNQPKMPSFAVGTDFAPGGMALVGEQGPELVNLPRGSQVFTNGETRDMMRGAKGLSVVVNNYSPQAIDPATSARLTKRSMRQLSFEGAF
jgi:tape measure domain-containing protein